MQTIDGFVIPTGTEVWRNGIFQVNYDKCPKSLKGSDAILALPDPLIDYPPARSVIFERKLVPGAIWIDRVGVDPKTEEYWISLRSPNVKKEVWIKKECLAQERGLAALAKDGFDVDINSLRPLARYLSDLLVNNPNVGRVLVGSRSGLYTLPCGKKGWLLKDRWVGPRDTQLYWTRETCSILQDALTSKGTLKTWVDRCKEYTEENPIVRWLVFSTFAAPLLNVCGVRSFIVHHWAESGAGKTAVLKLAQSAWGDPERFTASLNSTQLAVETQFQYVSDLHIGFDELQAADFKQDLKNLIYRIVLGSPRQRLNRSGTLQSRGLGWRVLARFTGEQPLLDNPLLDLGGVRNRTIELKYDPRIGVQKANEIHRWLATGGSAYGVAGIAYLKQIVPKINRDANDLKVRYYAIRQDIVELKGRYDARYEYFAIIVLGQTLARMSLYKESWARAYKIAWEDCQAVIELVEGSPDQQTVPFADRIIPAIELGLGEVSCIDMSDKENRETIVDQGFDRYKVLVNPGKAWQSHSDDWLWIRGHGALKSILRPSGLQLGRSLIELEDQGRLERKKRPLDVPETNR